MARVLNLLDRVSGTISQFRSRLCKLEEKLTPKVRGNDMLEWQKERLRVLSILDKRNRGETLTEEEQELVDQAYKRTRSILKILSDCGVIEYEEGEEFPFIIN